MRAPLLLAQSDQERAGARAVALEGIQAFQEERWAEAVDLLSRAESLVHAPTHLLFLARAQQRLGQLVSAREAYLKLTRESIAPAAPKAFHDAQAAAKRELPLLEPKIPTLKIQVKGAEGKPVSVTVDGKALSPALVGVANPTDPGAHRVQASAAGLSAGPVAVELKEAARETVTLQLSAATESTAPVAAPVEPANTTSSAAVDTGAPPAADEAPSMSSGNGLRIASYVAMGVGVVGLGAGTLFGLQSKNKRDEADEICPKPNACPISKRERVEGLDDDAGSAQKLSLIGFIAGGVGVATGVTLFVLSGKKQEQSPASASIRTWVGPLGLGVDGTF
ncbi:MAG TPA: hypothetical protein VK524_09855 [Polyangiaceae bacterium]|nr:hypothetical protein [Polyangiaceae bacterium]